MESITSNPFALNAIRLKVQKISIIAHQIGVNASQMPPLQGQ